jgi:hypothetical protein
METGTADAWSVAEVIAHLTMVEQHTVDGLRDITAEAPREPTFWRQWHLPLRFAKWRDVKFTRPIPPAAALLRERESMLAMWGEGHKRPFRILDGTSLFRAAECVRTAGDDVASRELNTCSKFKRRRQNSATSGASSDVARQERPATKEANMRIVPSMNDSIRRLMSRAMRMTCVGVSVSLGALLHVPCRAQAPANAPAQPQEKNSTSQAGTNSSPKAKRLILKNGSDEAVREYQVQGERVRYYSIERSEWEEVPTDLVDWEATRNSERAEEEKNQALVETVDKREKARQTDMAADVDASLEVAPSVFLPPEVGIYVLDGNAVFPLTQAEANEKTDKKRLLEQVVVPIPVVASRHNIVLDSNRARFRLQDNQPEFYVRLTDPEEPRLHLVKAKIRGNTRIVESLDTAFKNTTTKSEEIPLQVWAMAHGVYRLTLATGLAAGEYAFVEERPEKDANLPVWDFGVDKGQAAKSTK